MVDVARAAGLGNEVAVAAEPDFGAAGLLDDVPEARRASRLALLRRLHADGCSLDELTEAAAAGRLATLPVERMMSRRRCHSLADAARATGLAIDDLRRNHVALGLPNVDDDEPVYDDSQMENLHVVRGLLDQGMTWDDLDGLSRSLGLWSRRMAEALVDRLRGVFTQGEHDDRDVGQRYADFAELTLPVIDRMTGAGVRLHLLDILSREALGGLEREDAVLPGTRTVAVAFVDLTGYTAVSAAAQIADIESMAARFETLVADSVQAPARLVKLLGDGAMLVCDEPDPLIDAVVRVRDGASTCDLPPVHAGITFGPAVRSAGDWYGQTVNIAARLCDAAGPDEIVVSAELADAATGTYRFEDQGERRLKGVDDPVSVSSVD
jgi:adenylate cyclase